MAHSGTMDLGGSAQAKQSGGRWTVVMLTVVVVVATIAAVWFASSTGLVGGTSAIEAQRDAITLSSDEYLDGILDRAHATPFVSGAVTLPPSATSGTFHVTPVSGGAVTVPPSATSGTFHAGPVAEDKTIAPVDRPGVSGP